MRTLICGVGLAVVGVAPAAADDAAPPPSDYLVPVAPAVVVAPPAVALTGSLIERATTISPSPMTILTRDELLAAGRTVIGDILQPLTEQANGINAQVNNGGDGSTRMDIRGLGANRTLVLLNGRRYVPAGTGADSTVDLNSIPLAVIDRVEILKDAGSAVYGSGAIGGVVNIITRTSFTGTEASLYTGQSQRGDGFTYDASFVTGHTTDNHHGNIIFSAGIQRQDPVFAGDREFSRFDKVFDFTTRQSSISGSTSTPGGRINATQIDVDGDGQGDPQNICGPGVTFCTANGAGGYRPFVAPADLYNYQPSNFLYTPSSRFNAYTAGNYQLLSNVQGFFEASYLHRESDQQLAPDLFPFTPVSRDSIYNPFGGDVLDYRRRLEEFGPRAAHQSVDTFRTVVGIQGGMPDDVSALQDWKWELSYNVGRTDATQKTTGNLILSRVQNAVGASFIDANGVPTCGTPSAPITGCVPMNVLGASGSISPDAVAYAAFNGLSTGYSQEQTVVASAHGRLARLPNHGDISAAISTDFRKESGEFTPDPLVAAGDTTGAISPSVKGSFDVLEAAAEVSIVPARDADGLERLELDVAARAFRYAGFTGVTSSARALVRPIRGVTVRASYGKAFREPTVTELFQGRVDSFPSVADPCDNAFVVTARSKTLNGPSTEAECAREGVPPGSVFGTTQQREVDRGNPDLDPETAKVLTAGIVVEPVPGLALSADYWNIDVTQAIQHTDINTIFTNCYELGIRSYCDQIHRDPALGGQIDFVDNPNANIGGTATAGIDLAATYDRDAHDAGKLHVRAEAQRLLTFDFDNGARVLHAVGNYDLGVYPTMKASLAASWQHPSGLGAGFNLHLVGSFLECDQNSCNDGNPSRDVDAYAKVDVFGSYAIKSARGQTLVTVGVNNVFDRDPPLIYVGFAGDSDASTYDYLGRFFYARITQLF